MWVFLSFSCVGNMEGMGMELGGGEISADVMCTCRKYQSLQTGRYSNLKGVMEVSADVMYASHK